MKIYNVTKSLTSCCFRKGDQPAYKSPQDDDGSSNGTEGSPAIDEHDQKTLVKKSQEEHGIVDDTSCGSGDIHHTFHGMSISFDTNTASREDEFVDEGEKDSRETDAAECEEVSIEELPEPPVTTSENLREVASIEESNEKAQESQQVRVVEVVKSGDDADLSPESQTEDQEGTKEESIHSVSECIEAKVSNDSLAKISMGSKIAGDEQNANTITEPDVEEQSNPEDEEVPNQEGDMAPTLQTEQQMEEMISSKDGKEEIMEVEEEARVTSETSEAVESEKDVDSTSTISEAEEDVNAASTNNEAEEEDDAASKTSEAEEAVESTSEAEDIREASSIEKIEETMGSMCVMYNCQ